MEKERTVLVVLAQHQELEILNAASFSYVQRQEELANRQLIEETCGYGNQTLNSLLKETNDN